VQRKNRLASSEILEKLTVPISQTHESHPVAFQETRLHVSGEQSVLLTITSTLTEEQADDSA
jgi:hypothetical protein